MSVRIRKNGRIFCAAMSQPEPDDIYVDDGLHYRLSVELHALVTEPFKRHKASGGEWWWSGLEPSDIEIDRWWESPGTPPAPSVRAIRSAAQEQTRLWRNRAKTLNERARMHNAEGHLMPGDLREIVRRDGSRCVYCNRTLDYNTRGAGTDEDVSFDHIIRLCDGGSNTHENVVCACRSCNQKNNKKSADDPSAAALERLRWFLARKPGRVA